MTKLLIDTIRDELRPGDGVLVELTYNEWDWGYVTMVTETGFMVEFWPKDGQKFQQLCPRDTVYPDDWNFPDYKGEAPKNKVSAVPSTAVAIYQNASNTSSFHPTELPDDDMYVFVYGTLKKGGRLNKALAECQFIQKDITADKKFNMFSCADRFPAVSTWKGKYHIAGEIYKITPEVLKRLDALEGVPHLYRRDTVWTKGFDKLCYIYMSSLKLENVYENEYGSKIFLDEENHAQFWVN